MKLRIGLLALMLLAGCGVAGKASAWQSCENVVVGMVNGNQPVFQQQCNWLAGGVAMDPATRAIGSSWNHPVANVALAAAMRSCGPGCIGLSFFEDHYYFAASDNDDVGYGATAELAQQQCVLAARGARCDVVVSAGSGGAATYWYFNALAFNGTQQKAYGWVGAARHRDARNGVLGQCGGEPDCFAFVYQVANAAIARGEDGKLYASDGPTAGKARRAANKYCASQQGKKAKCEIVAESDKLKK
jgi:hypothetical protein